MNSVRSKLQRLSRVFAFATGLARRCGGLVWIFFVGTDDADLVIGEFGVGAGEFDLRHVTRDAARFCDGTMLHGVYRGRVASQTVFVVSQVIAYKVLVRIMAGGAGDAGVGAIEAFAIR